jgi:glycosyltransferase involved in cell wall biosynthesis
MRVHIVDPSAYTPPYDHALSSALAAAGAQVELQTSHFAYGAVAPAENYTRRERFYPLASRIPRPRARQALKLAEHVPNMLAYRRAARSADVVHFQWVTVPHLDGHLLPTGRPLLLTAHDVMPREPRTGQLKAQRALYEHFDAIVVHSQHGAQRLVEELGVGAERVHTIPHGAFAHMAAQPPGAALAPALPFHTDKPVALCFGLMRPYKGIDLLLEAWEGISDAELWIVGRPRMDISALQASAPPGVRVLARFISEEELPSYFRRADLLVLPYREIDQSGVLFTGLAFNKPLLLSDVGGFPEVAATGAARTFPAGDAVALHNELQALLADPAELAQMAERARAAADGPYSWKSVAASTLALYETLIANRAARA